MKELLIVGARGFGREVYNLAKQSFGYKSRYVIKGFLDDKSDALDSFPGYPPIIGSVEDYQIKKNDIFVVALGNVVYKKQYTELIENKNGKFYSLIHPTVVISPNTLVGKGAIIFQYSFISCDIKIGDHVVINPYCTLGHDSRIGNYSNLGSYTFLGGYSQVEELVTLHPRVSVLPHKRIHSGVIVGAGSVVMRHLPANITAHGNPARIIFSENDNI